MTNHYHAAAAAPDMMKAALWYAANGIPVFPVHTLRGSGCSCGDVGCKHVAKHPNTPHGFKDATTDPTQIQGWWTAMPDANIGIPTGALTGLLLLDFDPRNGAPTDRAGMVAVFGPLPSTAEVLTGGDGRHFYYFYPGGPVKPTLATGVDAKGDGGYVLAPPSLHRSGKRYQWDCEGGAEAILNPAPAPTWLLSMAVKPKALANGPATSIESAAGSAGKIGEGQRHKRLVRMAGVMQHRAMSPEAILAALMVENRLRCDPPKDEAAVRQIVESVCRYEPGKPDATHEWPDIIDFMVHPTDPIPENSLPGSLGDMALAVAASTETPFELAALLGLAVVSSCAARIADISPEPGYVETLNLYCCPAMESGNRKTAVFSRMIAPLVAYERSETARTEPERSRLVSEHKTMEASIQRLRNELAKLTKRDAAEAGKRQELRRLEEELPVVPVALRLFAEDATPERIASMLLEQGGSLGVFSDEGGVFDMLAGRYSGGKPNLDVWLKGHSASVLRVDRQDRSRPPIVIDKPLLSVGISPQPDVLATLQNIPGFRGRGLLARFLYALPQSRLGHRSLTPVAVPQDTELRYERGIHALLAHRGDAMFRLRFTAEAYAEWKAFQRQVEPEFREGATLAGLRDWGAKLPGAVARIAGVLHMAYYAGQQEIPVTVDMPTTVCAIEIGTALISHCQAVFALMDADPEATKAKRVIKWVLREGLSSFSARECFRAHQALFKRTQSLTGIVALLEAHGYVRVVRQNSSGGRPPSDLIEVNPALLARDKS